MPDCQMSRIYVDYHNLLRSAREKSKRWGTGEECWVGTELETKIQFVKVVHAFPR